MNSNPLAATVLVADDLALLSPDNWFVGLGVVAGALVVVVAV